MPGVCCFWAAVVFIRSLQANRFAKRCCLLLTGALEPTNEWHAIAKISGIKLYQALRRQHGFDAISLMPTNLYSTGDHYHSTNSHVLPALLRRFHEAKTRGDAAVTYWGQRHSAARVSVRRRFGCGLCVCPGALERPGGRCPQERRRSAPGLLNLSNWLYPSICELVVVVGIALFY